jgi:hypothetical protein
MSEYKSIPSTCRYRVPYRAAALSKVSRTTHASFENRGGTGRFRIPHVRLPEVQSYAHDDYCERSDGFQRARLAPGELKARPHLPRRTAARAMPPGPVTHARETTTASAIAVPRQAEAVTLFASVETSRAAHDPDNDAAKHAFPGPGSLVKIAHSRKFAVAGNYWAAGEPLRVLDIGPVGGGRCHVITSISSISRKAIGS